MNHLEQLHLDAIEKSEVNINPSHDDNMWVTDKKVAASKSSEITEQIAIEFAIWTQSNRCDWVVHDIDEWRHIEKDETITTREVFQEFLKFLNKIKQ